MNPLSRAGRILQLSKELNSNSSKDKKHQENEPFLDLSPTTSQRVVNDVLFNDTVDMDISVSVFDEISSENNVSVRCSTPRRKANNIRQDGKNLTSSPVKSSHTPTSAPSHARHDHRISTSFQSLSNDESDIHLSSIQPDLSLSPSGVLKYFQMSPNNSQPEPQLLKSSQVNDRPDSQLESNNTQLCHLPKKDIHQQDPPLPSVSAELCPSATRTRDIPDDQQTSTFAQLPSLSLETQNCNQPDRRQLASSSNGSKQLCPSETQVNGPSDHQQTSTFAQLPSLSLETQNCNQPDRRQLASSSDGSKQLCPSETQINDPSHHQQTSTSVQLPSLSLETQNCNQPDRRQLASSSNGSKQLCPSETQVYGPSDHQQTSTSAQLPSLSLETQNCNQPDRRQLASSSDGIKQLCPSETQINDPSYHQQTSTSAQLPSLSLETQNCNQPDRRQLASSSDGSKQLCPSETQVNGPSYHQQTSTSAQLPSLSLETQNCNQPDRRQLASSSNGSKQLCPSETQVNGPSDHQQTSTFAQLPSLSLETQNCNQPDRRQLASSSNGSKQLCPSETQVYGPSDHQQTSIFAQLPSLSLETQNCNQPDRQLASSSRQLASDSIDLDVLTDEHNITNVKKQQPKGKSNWKQNARKRQREMGSEYVSCSGKITPAKSLKDPCSCKSKDTNCSEFSFDIRNEIFLQVWSLSWNEKRNYIYGLVDKTGVKRRRTKGISLRNGTYQYSLKKNGQKLPVCRTMFLNTTGLTKYFVHSCFGSQKEDIPTDDLSSTEQGGSGHEIPTVKKATNHGISIQKSRPANPHYERGMEAHEFLQKFFDDLPKMPSHYCRKASSKIYVERRYRSLAELYKHYNDHCQSNNANSFQIRTFSREFHKRNLSIYVPKKDRCDTCIGYETGNISENDWQEHRRLLNVALEHKNADKQKALESRAKNDGQFAAFCMDLESVLLAPDTNASAMYFKTKLCVHNFTIYDLATADVTCYVWNETEGGLSANEFASCIVDYLKGRPVANEIVIYSDGCTYQNRNQILANAIQYFVETSKVKVHQKYLVKGHTHMEVDSSHSLIERALKGVSINVPHDYVNVMKSARKNPRPFIVKYLHHDFFKDYTKCGPYTSIRPGRKTGDPVVTDIHSLLYTPATEDGQKHVIQYKLHFTDEYQNLPHPPRDLQKFSFREPGALYQERLKIPASKYKHLQELKKVIDKDCHVFYDSLPHQ